jgi:CheY-like chemotaxis protein
MMVDVMMPGMDGPSFVQQLPEALARRTLFVTGAALSPEAQRAIARYPERLLEKPFTVTELVEALERIVAENAEASEEALGPGDRASGDDRRAADK